MAKLVTVSMSTVAIRVNQFVMARDTRPIMPLENMETHAVHYAKLGFFLSLGVSEQQVGQHRDYRNGHEKTQDDGACDGDGDVFEQLSGFFLNEYHRQKNRHRGQGGCENSSPHFLGSVICRQIGWFSPFVGVGRYFRGQQWRCPQAYPPRN